MVNRSIFRRCRRLGVMAAAALAVGSFGTLTVAPVTVFAQDLQLSLGSGTVKRATVRPGTTITVRTNIPYSDLVIARTSVADVVPLNDRSFYIQGNAVGATNVSIYNENKELLGVIDVRVRQDFSEVGAAVQAAVPGSNVTVSNVGDSIKLSGVVASATDLAAAIAAARQFTDKEVISAISVAGAQQVNLEVRIIEASRQAGRDLGIKWGGTGGTSSFGSGNGVSVNAPTGSSPTLSESSATDGAARLLGNAVPFGTAIAQVLSGGGVRVDVIIDALEKKGLARRLAQPNLSTMSGEPASFNVGGEIPISQVGNDGAVGYTYRKYGVGLKFIPTVLADSKINLRLETEVSEIDRSVNVNGNPGFITRSADSVLELRDGQSFAMAGMLQVVNDRDIEQLPWLGQVPVLGAMFRSTSYRKRETDLVILVTPRLVRPNAPSENLKTPLDNTRPSNDVELFAYGMLEVDKDMIRRFRNGDGVKGPYGHIIDLDFADDLVAKK